MPRLRIAAWWSGIQVARGFLVIAYMAKQLSIYGNIAKLVDDSLAKLPAKNIQCCNINDIRLMHKALF